MRISILLSLVIAVATIGCDGGRQATAPSGPQSFLTGTWRGTVTIEVESDAPGTPPPSSASTVWTFEIVPQTNLQTFRAAIHSDHPWLPIDTIATAALAPGNTPPAQISTQGDYSSPRGCRGTFGSFGTADTTTIDADFKGADCNLVTFTGRVRLTKQ
ncbi:MAG TPA: hypothetical protein VNR64_04695 [Vicinamibacterales bacterium]|nr:hypothetical protein [Vicinamibacterales bacterium]